SQSLNRVICPRTPTPLVRVCPQPELKMQSAPRRFGADELQHFEVGVAFGIRQWNCAHIVSRYRHQERIRKVEIAVTDVSCKIVTDAERQAEAIEPLGCEHCEVTRPKRAIVEPGLVFDITDERASDAANSTGRRLRNRLHR